MQVERLLTGAELYLAVCGDWNSQVKEYYVLDVAIAGPFKQAPVV